MEKPNILFIICDQMAPQLTGAYGHDVVKTPNLDRICEKGVRFDAAYSNSPICAPARASLLTGLYVSRIGTYDNGVNFPADIPTMAHMLRINGYEVVSSGKMHYLGPDQLHGLEKRLTQDIYPAGFKWVPDWEGYDKNGIENDKGHLVESEKIGLKPWTNQMNYDEDTHYHALEYIRRKFYTRGEPKKELDRPFCLFVSYTQPHSPYQTIKKYWDLYQDEQISLPEVMEGYKDAEISMDKWLREYEGISDELMDNEKVLKTLRRAYYGMVSYIDEKVGELMGCLERFDLKKSTAVFFLADHGDMVAERGLIEKRTFYEYSARIPLIGCWPGMWKEGVHIKEPVSLVDILPTISDLTEVEFPFEIDGTSFLPYLEKKSGDPQESRIAIGEYLCEGVKYPCFMVRRGKYKYVYVHKHDSQLFNLEQDPHELHNLSGDEDVSEVEQELKQIILDKFDCEKIRKQIITKQKRCMYIHEAMMEGEKTMWDLKPKQETSLKYDQ